MYDPSVYSSASKTMHAMLGDIARGSVLYVMESVPFDKVLPLVQKWHERYELDLNKSQRNYRRKLGLATFRLRVYPEMNRRSFRVWLLRTEGEHELLPLERWQDLRIKQSRLPWIHGYEVVRLPLPVTHRKKLQGSKLVAVPSVGWTWRYREEELQRQRALIRHGLQYRDDRLKQVVSSLQGTPGFRGARDDVRRMYDYIRAQAKKRRVDPPLLPDTIKWVTPRKGTAYPLSTLVKRARQGKDSWFP